MSNGQKSMTTARAKELLAEGWKLTQESMALVGTPIPDFIKFQIDGANHIRATRVAKLNELAKAIGAIEEDLERLLRGAPALVSYDADIERLRQERDALIELQRRASRTGCLGSTTVIEALYPDIPVKKKTTSEKAEDEQWLAIRKEAGLKIDPKTAEVEWSYGLDLDWELSEEFDQVGRQRWARSPESDIWVHFKDLPDAVREELWARHRPRIAFPAGLERLPGTAIEEADLPF
jgi:hypothetical protein